MEDIKVQKVGCQTEYDPAKIAVVRRPGPEFHHASRRGVGYLFEGATSLFEAQIEHDNYVQELKKKGVSVIELESILLNGTMDSNNKTLRGRELEDLRRLALRCIHQNTEKLNIPDRELIEKQKYNHIFFSHPKDLLIEILQLPSDSFSYNGRNTGITSEGNVGLMANNLFMRDQQITTDIGIVLGSMNSKERMSETIINRFAFGKIGAPPIYIVRDGKMEGGDFIPAYRDEEGKTWAFIGQGLRTNEVAIEELLKNNTMSFDYVVVIKDSLESQDQMHLDTYLNVVGPKKILVSKGRVTGGDLKFGKTKVDLYKRREDQYTKKESFDNLKEFLDKNGFKYFPVEEELQLNYALNFLTVKENEIIGVDIGAKQELQKLIKECDETWIPKFCGDKFKEHVNRFLSFDFDYLGERYKEVLEEADINYTLIPFNFINRAYGGPHCSIQVIYRLDPKSLRQLNKTGPHEIDLGPLGKR